MAEIHDRIPVIIPPGSYDRRLGMLDPNPLNLPTSFPSGLTTVWLISTKVNKPDNDDASVLDEISPTHREPVR
jgi:putative SOS response-associated peptidase YedK